ncbi:MAG: hypothetical protein IID18_05315, partial [Nitrospinae bacterium]|nr:hypothetical protein [Nitrospinota bacterium]
MTNKKPSTNKAKMASQKDGKKFLQNSFVYAQQVLAASLAASSETITHSGVLGAVNEDHWIKVIRSYLPMRYAIDTGIVIDSCGKTSEQIDIVIFDNYFTPSLLTQNNHRYIPVEAVYAIIECKPCIDKFNLEYASDKVASVRKLKRTSIKFISGGETQPKKELFPIAGGIVAAKVCWSTGLGASFQKNLSRLKGDGSLNFGCALDSGAFDSFSADRSLVVVPSNNALILFLFRLLWHLQSL